MGKEKTKKSEKDGLKADSIADSYYCFKMFYILIMKVVSCIACLWPCSGIVSNIVYMCYTFQGIIQAE